MSRVQQVIAGFKSSMVTKMPQIEINLLNRYYLRMGGFFGGARIPNYNGLAGPKN